MPTSDIWTPRRLESLLLDEDVKAQLEPLLQAVGFKTESARRIHVRTDVALLRWARQHRYILVCHDKYRDRKTNQYLYPEIYHRGGKVLRISGPTGQDVLTSLGKILVHREAWRKKLATQDGIAILYPDKLTFQEASKLYIYVQRPMDLLSDPAKALRKRKPPRRSRMKRARPPKPPTAGAPLI